LIKKKIKKTPLKSVIQVPGVENFIQNQKQARNKLKNYKEWEEK